MRVVEDDHERHFLRAGFDRAPQAYHRTRPVLPAPAFDDLISLAGLAPGHRVAEIGCGTGQASVPLAERGMVVTAVELGAGLAAIARRRLASFPSAEGNGGEHDLLAITVTEQAGPGPVPGRTGHPRGHDPARTLPPGSRRRRAHHPAARTDQRGP
jgi:SAM-dependent methyltransferase